MDIVVSNKFGTQRVTSRGRGLPETVNRGPVWDMNSEPGWNVVDTPATRASG
jgi:hypothetical protein